MNADEKWRIVHDYTRRVRRGQADPKLCPQDDQPLVPTPLDNLEPGYRCLVCRTVTYLGLDELEQMREI